MYQHLYHVRVPRSCNFSYSYPAFEKTSLQVLFEVYKYCTRTYYLHFVSCKKLLISHLTSHIRHDVVPFSLEYLYYTVQVLIVKILMFAAESTTISYKYTIHSTRQLYEAMLPGTSSIIEKICDFPSFFRCIRCLYYIRWILQY